MLKTLVFVSALIAAAASYKFSPFGIVEGIKDCGSPGRLGDVDVQGCTQVPCFFEPDSAYDISVKFSASLTSSTLALFVTLEDDTALLQVPINGNIEAGKEYELQFQLQVTQQFAGLKFPIRFQILDVESVFIEVCAEAEVEIGL